MGNLLNAKPKVLSSPAFPDLGGGIQHPGHQRLGGRVNFTQVLRFRVGLVDLEQLFQIPSRRHTGKIHHHRILGLVIFLVFDLRV